MGDSRKKASHAVAWGSLGPKYYYRNKQETLWAQEIHKKAMNTTENLYLLHIQQGSHKSLPLYEKVYGKMIKPEEVEYSSEPPRRAKGRFAGTTNRMMTPKEERLHHTVSLAKELNNALLNELPSVQGSIDHANSALNKMEYATFGRTYKSS